jgi:hypothetical protein
MGNADNVSNITQTELEQLVRHDTPRITESDKRMIREDRIQTHRPRMQNAFMAEIAQTGVAVDYLNAFPDEDLSEQRER